MDEPSNAMVNGGISNSMFPWHNNEIQILVKELLRDMKNLPFQVKSLEAVGVKLLSKVFDITHTFCCCLREISSFSTQQKHFIHF